MTHIWKRADGSRETRVDFTWWTFGLGFSLRVTDLMIPGDKRWVNLVIAFLFFGLNVDWYRGVK